MTKKIMTVFGTRPEAIKLAPVIHELERHPEFRVIKVSTSQHRQMLEDVLRLFKIIPDYDLQIMTQNQKLNNIVTSVLSGITELFMKEKPDLLIVQGDTSSAFTAALAAFNERIPVGHVEAGLRTWNIRAPYPEESNRRMISVLTDYHFAPTEGNKANLLNEKINQESIFVTGNTVIDALFYILKKEALSNYTDQFLNAGKKLILITAHRRENFGEPIRNISKAIRKIAEKYKDCVVVYPVHLNPNIREPVFDLLAGRSNIRLIDPVNYQEICHLMKAAHIILTDSGGIQEEAPSLGVPVLVLREKTERPEAVTAGTVKLVGTDSDRILEETDKLMRDKTVYQSMSKAINPYGDGKASRRIAGLLKEVL